MIDSQLIAITLFAVAYILIIMHYHLKTYIVWAGVAILLLTKIFTPFNFLLQVNWNVILLYIGMLFVSEIFLYSKMPDHLATLFASKTKKIWVAMLVICGFTGALSMFLENVACVLLVAPVALAISKKCNFHPVQLFIGMAISSNLQGTATLIGDPPSMLLGSHAGMTFNDFFFMQGKPGIFFAVEIGALVSLLVLYYFFRKDRGNMPYVEVEKYVSIFPTMIIIVMVLFLILSSFIAPDFAYATGTICMVFGAIAFVWYLFHNKGKHALEMVKSLDWETGVFLIGIFIIVASLQATGVISSIARLIVLVAGNNYFAAFMIIVWLSVLLSAFIDNVPYIIAMLPVVGIVSEHLGVSPYLLYFGLLIGASVGGNVTPIGASANIVAMGIMKREGHRVHFHHFIKIGLPFTIAATLASTMFLWFVWS